MALRGNTFLGWISQAWVHDRGPTATVRGRYGRVAYLRHDVWHGRAFRTYGEWSEAEVALWRSIVRPGATVVDVGAHIGAHTMALASLVGRTGRVHAIEPQHVVVDLLRTNTARLPQVTVWPVALAATAGILRYDPPDYGQPGNFGGVELGNVGAVEVRAVRLDDLAIGRVDFLKADVEGMEAGVLRGGMETLRRDRPVLYLENDRPDRWAALRKVLRELRYEWRTHQAPLFNAANYKRNPQNIFGNTISLNLLALPR